MAKFLIVLIIWTILNEIPSCHCMINVKEMAKKLERISKNVKARFTCNKGENQKVTSQVTFPSITVQGGFLEGTLRALGMRSNDQNIGNYALISKRKTGRYQKSQTKSHPWLIRFVDYFGDNLCSGVLIFTGCMEGTDIALTSANCAKKWAEVSPPTAIANDEQERTVQKWTLLKFGGRDEHLAVVKMTKMFEYKQWKALSLHQDGENEKGVLVSWLNDADAGPVAYEAIMKFAETQYCKSQIKWSKFYFQQNTVRCSYKPQDWPMDNKDKVKPIPSVKFEYQVGDPLIVLEKNGGYTLGGISVWGYSAVFYVLIAPKANVIMQTINEMSECNQN